MTCVDSVSREDFGPTEATDESLVLKIRQGDDAAASDLYHRYAARLRLLADRQMSSDVRRLHEAEDIVQSAFRSLFRGVNSGTYNAPEGRSLWSLLAVIAIHKVRRKATRNKSVRTTSLDDSETGSAAEPLEPESQISAEQFESSLRESMEGLKENERQIVELRVQGFSVIEIADRLQNSGRTVERILQRVREKLVSELDDSASG